MDITTIVILLAVIWVAVHFFNKIPPSVNVKLGHIAAKYGIKAEKVERNLPITGGLFSRMGDTVKLEKSECISYSLSHDSKEHIEWSLLQRFDAKYKATDYWVLNSNSELSEELKKAIHKFKQDFPEEFFEIEVKNGQIILFWEEWGNESTVKLIHSHMERFSRINA